MHPGSRHLNGDSQPCDRARIRRREGAQVGPKVGPEGSLARNEINREQSAACCRVARGSIGEADQWDYLSRVPRLTPNDVDGLAR